MFCTSCGKEVPEGKMFCPSCGTQVAGATAQVATSQAGYAGGQMPSYDRNQVRFQNTFVDPEEKYLGELGDGYFKGTLSSPFGVAKKCSAVVTDKRVYLQGKMIDASQGRINACSWVKTVDVADVTGTGFVASNPIGLLIVTIFSFLLSFVFFVFSVMEDDDFFAITIPLLVYSIIMLVAYLLRRRMHFVIEYAGGRIQFNASMIGFERVKAFQHLLIRAKDAAKQQNKIVS